VFVIVRHVGDVEPLCGFSSVAMLPGTRDLLVALKVCVITANTCMYEDRWMDE